jgi:hypothetical protein
VVVLVVPMHSPAMNEGYDSDDGGYGAHFQAEGDCDVDVRVYYDSLTPEVLGSGWFDQQLETLHQGIDITSGRSFFAAPRASDLQPSSIPASHPLRALAWVLAQAPVNSTVRIYCYMLTDPFAIDLLIHHGSNKTIQIILHTEIKNKSCIEEFFNDHGNIARRAFRDRLQVRIADISRYNFTSMMHDKSIITENHCTFGSYNLSCPARYQNWESVYVADSDQSQVQRFDQIWTSLANRDIQTVYPNLVPPSPSRSQKKSTT